MKRLTIVTTTFNSGRYIQHYCEGILGLNHLDQLQVMLVMNLPDRDEKRIVDEYKRQYPNLFRVLEVDKRETIGASLNRGFAFADTPYASFLDVDDIRVNDSFDRQIATLENNPDVDYTYGDYVVVKGQGERDGRYVSVAEFDKPEFTRESQVSPTHCFRADLIKMLGGFDEQLQVCSDFDFQVRAAFACNFRKTPGLLYYYTKYDRSGSSTSNVRLWAIEHVLIMLRYGQYDRVEYLDHYRYVKPAKCYRLDCLLINGEWQPVGRFVSNYRELMMEREPMRIAFEEKYRRWLVRNYAAWPFHATKRIARRALAQLGMLDTVRMLRDGCRVRK